MCKETDEEVENTKATSSKKKNQQITREVIENTSLPQELPKPKDRPKPPPENETIKLPDHRTDLDGDPLKISTKDQFVDLELSDMSGK